jgi:hypothetical protein
VSVTQRLGNAWEVVGTSGRFGLVYGLGGVGRPLASRKEDVVTYGIDLGYHLDRTRVGFQAAREVRTSGFSVDRDYARTRIASSVSYRF